MKRKETLTGICFILPGLIGFIIFILIPVIMSLGISFTQWNFLKGWDAIKFTGLKNYLKLFKDEQYPVYSSYRTMSSGFRTDYGRSDQSACIWRLRSADHDLYSIYCQRGCRLYRMAGNAPAKLWTSQ